MSKPTLPSLRLTLLALALLAGPALAQSTEFLTPNQCAALKKDQEATTTSYLQHIEAYGKVSSQVSTTARQLAQAEKALDKLKFKESATAIVAPLTMAVSAVKSAVEKAQEATTAPWKALEVTNLLKAIIDNGGDVKKGSEAFAKDLEESTGAAALVRTQQEFTAKKQTWMKQMKTLKEQSVALSAALPGIEKAIEKIEVRKKQLDETLAKDCK